MCRYVINYFKYFGDIILFIHRQLDKREGRCYMEIEERGGQKRCHHEMGLAVSKATCCCSVGKAWGSKCESCPGPNTEEYKTLCPGGTGYRPNPSTVNIESKLILNFLKTITFFNYIFSVNIFSVYILKKVILEDVNECEEHDNLCNNGHCTNTFGSYMCSCNEGYRLDNTSTFCYGNVRSIN